MSELSLLKNFSDGWFTKTVKENGSETEINCRISLEAGDLSQLLGDHYEKQLKYNYLSLEPEINGVPITADEIENYYVYLSERGYKVSKNIAQDALLFAAQKNGFHPVVEDLDRIVNDPKILPIQLDKVSTDYLGTSNDLYDSMLQATLIGMCARVFDRGCKFDTCCVLKGEQGIGKSSFWRLLAGDEWFCDTWQEKHQDLYMAIQTCWVMEIAELDSMTTKKDQGEIKAILSSSVDTFKRPYARGIGKHPRPSILVGSCNASDFLNDPTGSRRFWIIDLKNNIIDLTKLVRDRERILKAAVLAYRKGIEPRLTDKEQNESNHNNHLYEAENPFLARLIDWMNEPTFDLDYKNGFTTETALIKSGCREEKNLKNPDLKSAAECLRQLGFEKDKHQCREDGKKVPRKWRRCP